ncbi:MAG: hypothetical protein KGV44_01430 [Flavobacteriaceae bacterium]|nr:hypothetical protein [Flavobacteriaceae bacterium]
MELTEQQIQALYKFTRQHYVEHYDVQTELVDHLANDIENILEEHPNLTFEEARTRSFKKFGVFGFMDVYDERKKAISKKYYKIIWQHFKEWFRLPKILATLSLFLLTNILLEKTDKDIFVWIAILLIAMLAFIRNIYDKRNLKIKAKKSGKRWLLEDMIINGGSVGGIIVLMNWYNLFNLVLSKFDYQNRYITLLISALTTIYFLYVYVTAYVLPPKVHQFLEEHYPEYKFEVA